jgi:ribosomal protein S18 acetylase RimI-like enzyme
MLANYAALVDGGEVWIIPGKPEIGGVLGLLVLEPQGSTLMIENVAVHPDRQGIGLGGKLLDFAEADGRRRGFPTLTLYTNIAIYQKRGFDIVDRRTEHGFNRVYMVKPLR